MNILLVDDEPLARQRLRTLLTPHAGVKVVAEASTLGEARQALTNQRIDLVLLDINLFGEDGFDLLPDLPPATRVTFVTAHDEYAIKAFECQAIDYLLKPVEPERLARSLGRVLPGEGHSAGDVPSPLGERIPLRDRGRIFLVPRAEIIAVLAEGEYTRVISESFPPLLQRKPLQQWEKELAAAPHFLRVHRMALVNLEYAVRVIREESQLSLYLQGYTPPIPISGRAAARLKNRLTLPGFSAPPSN